MEIACGQVIKCMLRSGVKHLEHPDSPKSESRTCDSRHFCRALREPLPAMSTDKESRSNLRRLRSRPVCIICGRPAEAQQIARALGIDDEKHRLSGHDVSMVRDGHTFHLGEFKLPSGDILKYYITSSLRQGIQSFAVSAAILFNTLSPRFVLHAGVCAGFDDPTGKLELALRDVVFGEAAINYEEGKWEAQGPGGNAVFLPDYKPVAVEAGDMQGFTKSHKRHGIRYGEYISGSSVRGDAAQVFEKIRSSVGRCAHSFTCWMKPDSWTRLAETPSPSTWKRARLSSSASISSQRVPFA